MSITAHLKFLNSKSDIEYISNLMYDYWGEWGTTLEIDLAEAQRRWSTEITPPQANSPVILPERTELSKSSIFRDCVRSYKKHLFWRGDVPKEKLYQLAVFQAKRIIQAPSQSHQIKTAFYNPRRNFRSLYPPSKSEAG